MSLLSVIAVGLMITGAIALGIDVSRANAHNERNCRKIRGGYPCRRGDGECE